MVKSPPSGININDVVSVTYESKISFDVTTSGFDSFIHIPIAQVTGPDGFSEQVSFEIVNNKIVFDIEDMAGVVSGAYTITFNCGDFDHTISRALVDGFPFVSVWFGNSAALRYNGVSSYSPSITTAGIRGQRLTVSLPSGFTASNNNPTVSTSDTAWFSVNSGGTSGVPVGEYIGTISYGNHSVNIPILVTPWAGNVIGQRVGGTVRFEMTTHGFEDGTVITGAFIISGNYAVDAPFVIINNKAILSSTFPGSTANNFRVEFNYEGWKYQSSFSTTGTVTWPPPSLP